ncbi:hypothetical protein FN976_23030 [Caenimonas sedimenti]|uniref:DUF1570 domain-containing protein n=1 Tax=Caenimonas sedimenti TaxID=2596921 RepID=A0A562ZJK5_9BURK|nr:hypothetical protein [Caenimonas sedimenti]TWO68508.1 hypothetical protein FN976_23030 [Caenimonas sedimenti]
MLQWLKRKREPDPAPTPAVTSEAMEEGIVWRAGTRLPIPDWRQQTWPDEGDDAALHRQANGWAAAWLDATSAALPTGYGRVESPNFMLLSALAPRATTVLLDYLERSRKRVLATLRGIAADHGHGKTVVMVFGDEETYYQYIAHYGSESSQPEATSGGMFVDAGYGHFVFAQGPFETMEPVVVHELTHCLVRHLPIPAWLNEGLAVNTEHRFVPARPRYQPQELQYLMGRFWDASTIQEFWSGKSFLRPDDGQPLSYELAKLLVQLLDKDYELLARFCEAARYEDGGAAAAIEVLGVGLDELAAVVLGPGSWKAEPGTWADGTEKGQFRLA